MSIIERAAKLLGPLEQPRLSPPPGSAERPISETGVIARAFTERSEHSGLSEPEAVMAELDAIERAISGSVEHSGRIEPTEFAVPPKVKDLANELNARAESSALRSQTTQTLRINPNQLRRQCIITPDGERTPISESFRRIKRQILANVTNPRIGAPANLVLVTSALEGEGKTFCAINLAISIALEMDHTVLLVDADVARPGIPRVLDLKAQRGLLDVLRDQQVRLSDVLWKTDIDRLTILTGGTAHPHATELLASDATRMLFQEMAERYEDRVIIFDAPPLLVASEAEALARQVGQIVIVVEAGKTSEAALKAALSHIDSTKVTGLVLNKGPAPRRGYAYGGYG